MDFPILKILIKNTISYVQAIPKNSARQNSKNRYLEDENGDLAKEKAKGYCKGSIIMCLTSYPS